MRKARVPQGQYGDDATRSCGPLVNDRSTISSDNYAQSNIAACRIAPLSDSRVFLSVSYEQAVGVPQPIVN
jgi:hypothetical protein